MTMPPSRSFALTTLSLCIAALGGCATTDPSLPGAQPTVAPAAATITDFSAGLRCMDSLLLDYGTGELPVTVEEGAAEEALVSALSDMSRRSRLVRVVADPAKGGKAPLQALRPQYAVRSSVSQDDKAVAVDMRMLSTQDMTVVPGVASRNQAALSKDGAEVRKFGLSFSIAPDATRRALVELGAIEMVGRLAKVPYWTCLGGGNDDPEVAAEIRDWYDAMAARPKELIEYFQRQLHLRGVYDGPADGVANPQFKEAVARYREALGQSRENRLTREFMKAYLGANHRELLAKVTPVATAAAPAPATKLAPEGRQAPLAVRVAAANDARQFERGETIQLLVKPSRDAHVYCFMQDENRKVTRFFPNRFQSTSLVAAGAGVQLPGAMRFEIRMNDKRLKETVSCFATERDVLADLPGGLGTRDFAPLPVASLDQVRDAFSAATGGVMAHETFQVRPR